MTDRPIIFSGPMVRALLDGRKTMTRRLAWRHKETSASAVLGSTVTRSLVATPWQKVQPGDRLWVRENWRADSPDDPQSALYMADEHTALPPGFKWRPSIHMPRWASRITLTVTATKLEPLQAISEEDAIAEGATRPILPHWPDAPYRSAFRGIWHDLHGRESWEANPEIVALTFTVERRNIDAAP